MLEEVVEVLEALGKFRLIATGIDASLGTCCRDDWDIHLEAPSSKLKGSSTIDSSSLKLQVANICQMSAST